MTQASFAEQVAALNAMLGDVETRVARGQAPDQALAEFMGAVDELRLRVWALLGVGSAQVYGADLVVRNVGSEELLWRVLPSPSPNQFGISCEIDTNDDVAISCLEDSNLLPGGQIVIRVFFSVIGGGPVPGSGVSFVSSVGDLVVPSIP